MNLHRAIKGAVMSKRLAIVLAAGKGVRMKSDLPKVLCQALGRPLVSYVLDALEQVGVDRILTVVGYRSELVREKLKGNGRVEFVDQTKQLGTGHAVIVCRDKLIDFDGPVLIVAGDSPMIQPKSVKTLFEAYERGRPACILGTLMKDDPTSLGRIVRDNDGNFVGIVEHKDADETQRQIKEVNMSTYLFDCRELLGALEQLRPNNNQEEYYITDCPGILKREGKDVRALPILQPCEALSVNTVDELAIVEAEMRKMGYRCES
jgi:bifunctional UDP-N-acetylglucosamine pyrophosphorylase/glucosamine-1-phosphate N-acetyltransferase/UDP-N-acetylglucosamine pyrophosphorylase